MSESLWQLTDQSIEIESNLGLILDEDKLDENAKQELIQEYLEEYLNNQEKVEEKFNNIADLDKYLEYIFNGRKQEIKRLQELNKKTAWKRNNLRKYMAYCLEKVGKKQLQTKKYSLSLKSKPHQLVLPDIPEQLPIQYQKIEVNPNKILIKNDLKYGVWDGKNQEGSQIAWLEPDNSKSIVIK